MRSKWLALGFLAISVGSTISARADPLAFSALYSTSGIFGLRYGTLPSNGFGYWGEFKLNAPSHSPSYETISRRTVETVFNDPFREEIIQHFNVNAGAIYGVSESFW
ncbi:hypothetical protein EBZ37_08310, partial [bacterium]|nr:hypothetical protein [bacterium]